jgi:hypothetical protein
MFDHIQPEKRKCANCGFSTETVETECPKCRKRYAVGRNIRISGAVLIVLGGALCGFMAYVIGLVNGVVEESRKLGKSGSFDPARADFAYLVLFTVIAIGAAFMVVGSLFAITGRRHPRVAMFLSVFIIVAVIVIRLATNQMP